MRDSETPSPPNQTVGYVARSVGTSWTDRGKGSGSAITLTVKR